MSKSKNEKLQEERIGKPYQTDKFASISPKKKIYFLKFWVAGVSYFMAFMTLEIAAREDMLDQLFAFLIIMTLLTEYLTNKIIVGMDRKDQKMSQYLLYSDNLSRKSLLSLIYTFVYSLIMVLLIYFIHQGVLFILNSLNLWSLSYILHGNQNGMDPFSVGLYYLIIDSIYLKIRNKITNKKRIK